MCDYSLSSLRSRDAKVGDRLITTNFLTGTIGFSDVSDDAVPRYKTAVCVRPGTEIAFDVVPVRLSYANAEHAMKIPSGVAIFRQINKHQQCTNHDALEFPDGQIVLLTALSAGQVAHVLQLPAEPKTEQEAAEQRRVEYIG